MTYTDSTAICNSSELNFGNEEHFMGCSVSRRFSWPMIEPVNDEVNLIIGDCIKQAALGMYCRMGFTLILRTHPKKVIMSPEYVMQQRVKFLHVRYITLFCSHAYKIRIRLKTNCDEMIHAAGTLIA
ncbi:MAG: hypothetical protein Q9M12_07215 [Mariprofundus sp.]|nr:hypothetical protein [Mariprofundus sp.]